MSPPMTAPYPARRTARLLQTSLTLTLCYPPPRSQGEYDICCIEQSVGAPYHRSNRCAVSELALETLLPNKRVGAPQGGVAGSRLPPARRAPAAHPRGNQAVR